MLGDDAEPLDLIRVRIVNRRSRVLANRRLPF